MAYAVEYSYNFSIYEVRASWTILISLFHSEVIRKLYLQKGGCYGWIKFSAKLIVVYFNFFCRDISKEDDLPPVQIDSVAFTSLMVQALESLYGKV